TADCIRESALSPLPDVDGIQRWHHRRTLEELRSIKGYIDSISNVVLQEFLLVTFSSILPATTGRRGQQHGFFADNTPLQRGLDEAAYVDAIELFVRRVGQNVKVMESLYGSLAKSSDPVADALGRASVFCQDVRGSRPRDYGIEPNTIAAVVTSPPY